MTPDPDRFYNRPLVFEIGNSLREARVRQALDFPEIEQATKIRGKYLRALEDENFEQLPGQTYVKGFLRTYADYLGLEGQLYVDEYNSRYVVGAGEEDPPLRQRGGGAMPRSTRLMSSAVLIALTVIGVATALVIAAWKFGGAEDRGIVDVGGGDGKPAKKHPATTRKRGAVDRDRRAARRPRHQGRLVARGAPRLAGRDDRVPGHARARRHPGVHAAAPVAAIDYPRNVVVKLNGMRQPLHGAGPLDLALTNRGLKTVG